MEPQRNRWSDSETASLCDARLSAARAVGGAVGRNPIGVIIPCHRVIAGDGTLGGYGSDAWGSHLERQELKRSLLRVEGVAAANPTH